MFCRQPRFNFEFTNESSVGRLCETMRHPTTEGTAHVLGPQWDSVSAVARTFPVFPDDEPGKIALQLLRVGVEYIDPVFKESFGGRVGVLLLLAFRLEVKAALTPLF